MLFVKHQTSIAIFMQVFSSKYVQYLPRIKDHENTSKLIYGIYVCDKYISIE